MGNASYDESFKSQAVKYVKESGQSATSIARELKNIKTTFKLDEDVWQ
jgi:hypothetical protein